MKKWLLPTIIVCIFWVVVWSIFWNKQLWSGGASWSFLSFVPGDIDQVMYIYVDEPLLTLMKEIESQTGYTGQPLATHLMWVQSLLVGQFLRDGEPVNILFVKAEKETAVSDLQQIGVIASDVTYTAKKLWKNTWAYGDEIALEYLHTYKGTMLDELTGVQLWSEGMQWGNYNVWFVSRGKGGGSNPLIAQFGKKLEYTMALSHLALQQSEGNIIMQFSPWTLHPGASDYVPELASHVKSDPLVYIEFQDILGTLWLPDEQVVAILPLIISQTNPAFARLLAKDDYYDIVTVLHDNIALSLDVTSGGWVWLGAAILFHHPKANGLIKIIKPILRSVVETFLWTWTITEKSTEQWFTLTMAIPGLEAMIGNGPFAKFDKLPGDAWSVLSILMDTTSVLWEWIDDLVYTPQSIASFSIDTKAMERLQKSAPEASLDGLAAGQYLTQGVIKGHIVLDEATQQVRLIYQVVGGK